MRNRILILCSMIMLLLLSACAHKTKELVYSGTLDGVTIQVPALTGGKINQLLVDEGQLIQKDSTIAIIDTEDLHYQLQQLQANQTVLSANEKIALANVSQASTDIQYVNEKYQRTKELVQNQSASQQTLDDITNLQEKSKTLYENSTQNLKQIQGNIKQVTAQIASLEKKIRDATIKSPATGTITTLYYQPGEAIPPLGNIVQIVDTRELNVKIYVSVKLLDSMKMGQEVTIKTEGDNREYKGNIQWISTVSEFTPKNVLTPETRSSLVYAVKIRVMNPNGVLKQGMPVEVKLPNPETAK